MSSSTTLMKIADFLVFGENSNGAPDIGFGRVLHAFFPDDEDATYEAFRDAAEKAGEHMGYAVFMVAGRDDPAFNVHTCFAWKSLGTQVFDPVASKMVHRLQIGDYPLRHVQAHEKCQTCAMALHTGGMAYCLMGKTCFSQGDVTSATCDIEAFLSESQRMVRLKLPREQAYKVFKSPLWDLDIEITLTPLPDDISEFSFKAEHARKVCDVVQQVLRSGES